MALDQKDPDVNAEYGIDFHDELVTEALPRMNYALNEVLFFAQDTGFYYQVTTAGKTGLSYPRNLARVSGDTVKYGSCVLTCKAPSEVSIASISTAAWTLPSGITNASQRTSGLSAFITLAGGTDGVDYDITCRLTPSVGNPIDKTITIQVRAQ
jgi:hypothetical protein